MTKPIASVAIFSLIEKGRLRGDDKVFGTDSILGTEYGKRPYGQGVEKITIDRIPGAPSHQCIQVGIEYGLDTNYANNLTQRNESVSASAYDVLKIPTWCQPASMSLRAAGTKSGSARPPKGALLLLRLNARACCE